MRSSRTNRCRGFRWRRAFWTPRPDLKTAAAAWIYAGGPHHTAFSQAVTTECIEDFAEMAAVECVVIDRQTLLRDVKNRTPLESGVLRRRQNVIGA